MADKTRADLINRALSVMGAVGAGQVASANDYALMDALLEPLLAELDLRGVVYVADPNIIDAPFFEHLARLLAARGAIDFGFNPDPAQVAVSEQALRRMQPIQWIEKRGEATYF
jgi:hypothetical protein